MRRTADDQDGADSGPLAEPNGQRIHFRERSKSADGNWLGRNGVSLVADEEMSLLRRDGRSQFEQIDRNRWIQIRELAKFESSDTQQKSGREILPE